MLTLTAKLANNGAETTTYTYGVSNMNCDTTGSCLYSTDLLYSVAYPGQPTPLERYAYNALSETAIKTDRNGTVHNYTFDVLGRLITDAINQLGAQVDGTIMRIDTAFDTRGRPYLYTSYGDTGGTNVKNQVQQTYNGLSQLITEVQSHTGVVTGTSPKVQYTYSEMPGGINHSRLTATIYPNGRQLNSNYATGLEDSISRLTSLQDNGAPQPLEVYSYLGLNTVAKRSHPEPQLDLTYINQPSGSMDGGDQYMGLDRFGRVIDQLWIPSAGGTPTDRFTYTYDRDGNRLSRKNALNASLTETYFGATGGYDALNRLTDFSRGSHTLGWGLDAQGNWGTLTTDGGVPQTRTHNAQNHVTSVTGATNPLFDNNGNTTRDERNNTYVFDAWNRLVRATSPTLGTVNYAYDALNRRIVENRGTALDLYYSSAWQVVEEQGTGGVTQAQYVWSPVYVDALVVRDLGGLGGPRLYVQQDPNWNVAGVVGTVGPVWTVLERYIYDPYGKPSFLNAAWTDIGASSYAWVYLHQGGRYDATSGLYNFRYRDLSPALGRWMQQDPIGYVGGDQNLYSYDRVNPVSTLDPTGTWDLGPVPSPNPIGTTLGAGVRGGLWGIIIAEAIVATKLTYDLGYETGRYFREVKEAERLDRIIRNRPRPKPKPEKKGPCEFYLAWCIWGTKCRKDWDGWTQSVGDCNLCYQTCVQSGGTWPFDVCPIAGGPENPRGPRWPGPDDDWQPVWP